MDDVTDVAFRQLIAETYPPDVMYTEFVSVDGLASAGRDKLYYKTQDHDADVPLIVQIWGLVPDNYYKIAKELSESKKYVGIDINMGCPTPVVTRKGACSALINNRTLAAEIIQATKEGAGATPVSVKARIGYKTIQTEDWCGFLLQQGLDTLVVHGRTTKEMSKVPNHWDQIQKVRELRDSIAPGTKIVGNGDVTSRSQGELLAQEYGLDGIMIGRGIFADPAVFAQEQVHLNPKEKLEMFLRHIELFEQYFGNSKNPAKLKKFAKMYTRDFDRATQLRSDIMKTSTLQELKTIISNTITVL